MLPSRFFLPAIPVILDDPSSIATINSFDTIIFTIYGFTIYDLLFSIYFLQAAAFLADDLVVELQTDIGILVPAGLGESVLIELGEPVELTAETSGLTEIDHMIAYKRYHLDGAVGEHVKLLGLTEPERMLDEEIAYAAEHFLCIALGDGTSGNNQVADILRVGHDIAVGVDIIVVSIVSLDTDDGQPLRQIDIHTASMGLIALGRLDKGVLEQGFLNLPTIDLVDEVAQRIDFGPYQLVFHILGIEETAHATLLDVDLHFGAYVINLVRAVEYRDGQYEIDGNDDVYQYKQRFLPVDAHDFVIYYLLFSILD